MKKGTSFNMLFVVGLLILASNAMANPAVMIKLSGNIPTGNISYQPLGQAGGDSYSWWGAIKSDSGIEPRFYVETTYDSSAKSNNGVGQFAVRFRNGSVEKARCAYPMEIYVQNLHRQQNGHDLYHVWVKLPRLMPLKVSGAECPTDPVYSEPAVLWGPALYMSNL